MNAELAKYHLRRLMKETEPKDYSDLDGFLGSLVILAVMALAFYVIGVLWLLFTK